MDGNELSVRLYDILEDIGVSEAVRGRFWENAMLKEIFETAWEHYEEKSVYFFGSYSEGTTTPNLNSDIDRLFCDESLPVIDDVHNSSVYPEALLMVTDDETRPGYVRLQLVTKGIPLNVTPQSDTRFIPGDGFDLDNHGNVCMKHQRPTYRYSERNGPAYTCYRAKGLRNDDTVFAVRCRNVPQKFSSWIRRNRKYDWLPKHQLQRMESFGCFFVGVGHPKSPQSALEWRISFSLQERELMKLLNPTQHKCYVLLKLVKKDMIQPHVGEKSISSYHLKTCLLQTIENDTNIQWNKENLIQCTLVCLRNLFSWVEKENCPNYFIPEENMFERIDNGSLRSIAIVLNDILALGVRFPFKLNCDMVGRYMSISYGVYSLDNDLKPDFVSQSKPVLYKMHYKNTIISVYRIRNVILRSFRHVKRGTNSFINDLTTTTKVTEHADKDIKMASDFILPHLHIQRAKDIASSELKTGTRLKEVLQEIHKGKNIDLLTSNLILATYYLRLEMLGKCHQTIVKCETSLKDRDTVISVCYCEETSAVVNDAQLQSADMSTKEFQREHTAGCMVFQPHHTVLVPQALQFEMYRSVFTLSRNETDDYWFDWSVVDSKVYLYLLEYIMYSKSKNVKGKQHAIRKMRLLLKNDPNLGHRETGFNLLGWMLSEENKSQEAADCFKRSWEIRPFHNAAKWHMVLLLYKYYCTSKCARG